MSHRPSPEPRSAYRHFEPIQTRWGDNDVYGHVNNVVYYAWFDTAVNEHLIRAGGLDLERDPAIGLVVEFTIFFVGLWLYVQNTEPTDPFGRHALLSFAVVMPLVYLAVPPELFDDVIEGLAKADDGSLAVSRPDDERESRSLHGLTRSLVNNMVIGVTDGYSKGLEIVGVGYRVAAKGSGLEFALGFSHPVVVDPPVGEQIPCPDILQPLLQQVRRIDVDREADVFLGREAGQGRPQERGEVRAR